MKTIQDYLSKPPKGWEWVRNIGLLLFLVSGGLLGADKLEQIYLSNDVYVICQYVTIIGGVLGFGAQAPSKKKITNKKSKRNAKSTN